MRTRSKRRITHLHATKRRSWEDKMVINKISILPTRMKLKELVLVVGTWLLWIFTIVMLIVEGSAILHEPIKFGWTGLELLKILGVIFTLQIIISCIWSWFFLPKDKDPT